MEVELIDRNSRFLKSKTASNTQVNPNPDGVTEGKITINNPINGVNTSSASLLFLLLSHVLTVAGL